jgi:hypothetical protein
LGIRDTGALTVGARADLAVLDEADWRSAVWQLGPSPVSRLFLAGKELSP